jgi:hypothetical protein
VGRTAGAGERGAINRALTICPGAPRARARTYEPAHQRRSPPPPPHPPVTTAFRLVSGAAWSRAERAEPGRHFGIAPRNHSLSTMFLPPALIVSHFWLGTGQTCFKNPGFGWRSGEKACSSQAIKTGQFRLRACTLLSSPTRSRGSHQLRPHLSACLAATR